MLPAPASREKTTALLSLRPLPSRSQSSAPPSLPKHISWASSAPEISQGSKQQENLQLVKGLRGGVVLVITWDGKVNGEPTFGAALMYVDTEAGGEPLKQTLAPSLSTGNESAHTKGRYRIPLHFLQKARLKVGTLLEKAKNGGRGGREEQAPKSLTKRRGGRPVCYPSSLEKEIKRWEGVHELERRFQRLSKVGYSLGREPRKTQRTFLKELVPSLLCLPPHPTPIRRSAGWSRSKPLPGMPCGAKTRLPYQLHESPKNRLSFLIVQMRIAVVPRQRCAARIQDIWCM